MKDQAGVKERIISTASRLFYEQGYQATGINQIIEEAEIAKASLYQHFSSKENLLNEYLQDSRQTWREDLMLYTGEMQAGLEKLEGLFNYRLQLMQKRNFKGCTFCRVSYELPNLAETSADIIRTHKNGIKVFIADQLKAIRSAYKKEDLEEMTEILFNISEGAVLQSTMYRSSKPLEMAKLSVLKMIKALS